VAAEGEIVHLLFSLKFEVFFFLQRKKLSVVIVLLRRFLDFILAKRALVDGVQAWVIGSTVVRVGDLNRVAGGVVIALIVE